MRSSSSGIFHEFPCAPSYSFSCLYTVSCLCALSCTFTYLYTVCALSYSCSYLYPMCALSYSCSYLYPVCALSYSCSYLYAVCALSCTFYYLYTVCALYYLYTEACLSTEIDQVLNLYRAERVLNQRGEGEGGRNGRWRCTKGV